MREEDWQDTPEAIAAWLRWYDSLEPLQFTPQEEAKWQDVSQAQKEREKAAFAACAEELRRTWEQIVDRVAGPPPRLGTR
jgi:hypothetical protein